MLTTKTVLTTTAVLAALTFTAVGSGAGAAATLASPGFTDTFGAAVNDAPGYGLNDSLAKRQSGTAGVTYTRESGVWYSAPPPQEWYSQVNHAGYRGELSFWLGTSAVRMDPPVIVNPAGVVGVQATVDPVAGDQTSQDWSSLVLSTNAGDTGYVANPGVALGVLVRSGGGVQVLQDGTSLLDKAGFAKPGPHGQFKVILTYTPGQSSARIEVNGKSAQVAAPDALPASASLFMGAYLSNSKEVSTLKDLSVSAVNMAGLTLPASSGLRYYGYYAARLTGPSHLAEVAGRSNLNWVNISDVDGYKPGVLMPEDAPLSACAGLTGHETDSDIAALQQDYYNLAVANPRVIGLLNFGFWVSPAWQNGGAGAASLPLTVDSNERVAARILAATKP